MYVIGLISGTSVDGIDAALVDMTGTGTDLQVTLVAGATYSYPIALREQILAVCQGEPLSMQALAELDDAIAQAFAEAALAIQTGHPPAQLIGSHGQTVFHRSRAQTSASNLGYSLQLGRGALIAHRTGITTISNFRAADIAAGGEGAPLVSPIDRALLTHANLNRCVQNIGGISNVTYLPARHLTDSTDTAIVGWDTGPGNCLIDGAVAVLSQGRQTYDRNGEWAASGTPCLELVDQWLQQDFFQQPPPKSTGRELFSTAYLKQCLAAAIDRALSPADTLATLTELTAASIAHSYRHFLPQLPDQMLVCGGGSRNRYLRQRLARRLERIDVLTTDDVGLDADFKEAIAFAVLAYWRYLGVPGNLPAVTGAMASVLLGEVYPASQANA